MILKSVFCASLEGAQFYPAKVVYYVRRFQKEEAIKGKTSGLIGKGEWVTWRAKHFGFYQTLTSKIVEFERPDHFVDEMIKGAFKSFRHQHYFTKSDLGTLMIDYFEYKSPLGFLGNLADSLFLEKYMKKLLEKRNQTIKEFAESDMWKQVLGK